MTSKETLFSPGDALRDVYARGIVSGDFVLVAGDLVSNVNVADVVRVHKERRKLNKDVIMTMVVKETGGKHRTRCVLFAFRLSFPSDSLLFHSAVVTSFHHMAFALICFGRQIAWRIVRVRPRQDVQRVLALHPDSGLPPDDDCPHPTRDLQDAPGGLDPQRSRGLFH
jgi:hypothetical protein